MITTTSRIEDKKHSELILQPTDILEIVILCEDAPSHQIGPYTVKMSKLVTRLLDVAVYYHFPISTFSVKIVIKSSAFILEYLLQLPISTKIFVKISSAISNIVAIMHLVTQTSQSPKSPLVGGLIFLNNMKIYVLLSMHALSSSRHQYILTSMSMDHEYISEAFQDISSVSGSNNLFNLTHNVLSLSSVGSVELNLSLAKLHSLSITPPEYLGL
ncbi:hypothetical protein Tco_0722958 [Tanacetum coccineum]